MSITIKEFKELVQDMKNEEKIVELLERIESRLQRIEDNSLDWGM